MSTMNASEIISVLKSEIEDFDRKSGVQETGTVVRVGDGIATVFGMQHAMYGELVEFETGVRGIVQNLETKTIGVVLLGSDYGITEGTSVVRTGKRAGIGVTQKMIGRVVGALGNPIDGGDPLEAEDYFPIEHEAPGVAYRKSVNVPLQTGILSIDSMFPIGRGQRELIIGDDRTEVLYRGKDRFYPEEKRRNGLFHCSIRIRQRTGSGTVYRTVCRHGNRRIFHEPGQGRADRIR